MDDATLNRLVDDLMQNMPGSVGSFHGRDANLNHSERENDIRRQYLMASLRHGYFSSEIVPVDATGRLDVDYGNRGPEINMLQQMTSTGVLAAVNSEEISKTGKQERYRTLSLLPRESFGDGLMEEINALEADNDVHSVSVISALHDLDPARYKHCSIDCWLKTLQNADHSPVPALSTSCVRHPKEPFNGSQPTPYKKLENNQKRLVYLLPGHYGDPIICKVTVLTVCSPQSICGDTQLEYEALSYTWGDPTPTYPIELDGKVLLVSKSAFTALQHLRHETDSRTLWIDTICINQYDRAERSEQVILMNHIYNQASRVIVWLGEEFEDSRLAITSMKYLDEKGQREEITLRSHDDICYKQLKRIYKAQCRIFESPWFRRSWIRQEVMAAKEIVVVCGRDTVPWYCMKRSAARVRRIYSKMIEEDVSDLTEFHNDQSEAIACLSRDWIYGQPVAKFIGCIRSVWYNHTGGLLDLLMTGREYEASDAKDKVYSVLGLARVPMTAGNAIPAPDTRAPAFPVDYHKSVSEVYQDVVKFFINRDRNLDILSILLTHRNSASNRDLPSWVPDWRVSISEIRFTAHWDFISMKVAAGGFRTETQPQSFDEKGILRVQGYVFDAIQQLDDFSATVHNVLCTLAEFDDDEDGPINQARQRGEFAMFSEPFDPQKHKAKCGRTAKGEVCLASINARPRDYIAVFLGAKHPFVIRPIESETLDSEASNASLRASIVGPCIVPHAMFGKLVKIARESNITPTEFTLL
ncbi:hypothetical protein N7520_000284 [Penicillium odoratum]|uniref:uncharacterized protein n=1 Tax=Penicillium odoratum TaxID=1167516 RepID=UPI002547E367|nr:uncharacterized protein N7520_000284 [Penicillium odoratum]KAJ5777038.1 hypothetical protein N7520_000284 [Penicillium odoratum]